MGKQFIERNPVVIGVITAVLIVATLYAALTVSREDVAGGYVITVQFRDANGLSAGDLAVVAGIQAGKVVSVDIVEDYIEAQVQMAGSVQLPVDTRASISVRTLVGKKAIELYPGTSDADYEGELLEDGDTIPLEQTSVTIDVPQLAESAEDLLTDIDSDALNTLLVAVADVTRGQRDEVAGLVDSGTDLTELVNDQEQQIRDLLRNLSTLSQILESRDDELVGIIDDLDVALANLAARRADLQRLLSVTLNTSTITADFLARVRADLDGILDEVHLDLEIVRRHQLDVAEGLAYLGDALVGFSSIAYAQGVEVQWGHVFVTAAGPAGLDALVGCGGLVDQQIDALLGPDPRTCDEQNAEEVPPADSAAQATAQAARPADPPAGARAEADEAPDPVNADGPILLAPRRLGIDYGPRTLLDALGVGQ